MIIAQAIIQLKAFARQDGAILALVWIASFASLVISPHTSWATCWHSPPQFIVGWRLTKFRNYALDGVISFRRALAYSWYTFFYASLLFAIAQFLYFRFLNNGVIASMLMQTANMMIPYYKAQGMSAAEIHSAMNMLTTLSPLQITFLFMMQNLFIGLIISLPIAAVCARRVKKTRI
jgi:hypothetical protein